MEEILAPITFFIDPKNILPSLWESLLESIFYLSWGNRIRGGESNWGRRRRVEGGGGETGGGAWQWGRQCDVTAGHCHVTDRWLSPVVTAAS
jgi:hypothetical protein